MCVWNRSRNVKMMLCKAAQVGFLLHLTLPYGVTAAPGAGGLCFCTRKFHISEQGVHLINGFLGGI